jgi:hypothetical protein
MSDETTTTAGKDSVQIPPPIAWLVARVGWGGTFFLFMMLLGGGGWGVNDISALATGQLPPSLKNAPAVEKDDVDLEALLAANQALDHLRSARIAAEHQTLLRSIDIIREQCKSGSDE